MAGNDGYLRAVPSDADPDDGRLYDPTQPDGGNVYNESVTEALAAVDAQAVAVTFGASVAEVGALADALAVAVTINGTLAESVAASDASSVTVTVSAAVTESGAAADTQTVAVTVAGSRSESVTAADASAATATFAGAVNETGTLADAQAVAITAAGSVTEAGAVADGQTAAATFGASVAESGSVSASESAAVIANGAVSESGSASDANAVATIFAASAGEAATVSDLQNCAVGVAGARAESVTAQDAAFVDVDVFDFVDEFANALDLVEEDSDFPEDTSDSLAVQDLPAAAASMSADDLETLTISDSAVATVESSVPAGSGTFIAERIRNPMRHPWAFVEILGPTEDGPKVIHHPLAPKSSTNPAPLPVPTKPKAPVRTPVTWSEVMVEALRVGETLDDQHVEDDLALIAAGAHEFFF